MNDAFVMPEDEWVKLCRALCSSRRRQYPGTDDLCDRDGSCEECVSEAADRVPEKYLTSLEDAREYDPLPGCSL